MHRKNPLQQFTEVRLKEDEVLDIWDVFHKAPYILLSHDMFIAMVLNCPPVIELASLKWEESDELKFLMKTYWLPFLHKVYTWFKCIGVCPWYWERVNGTEHYIPVVPPVGAGYMTTYLDDKHRQQFHYYWNNTKSVGTVEPDKNVRFEHSKHIPGLDGSIRSPVASLLYEWRTAQIVRRSTEITTDQQAHQQHVFEFHPAKVNQGDDNLSTLESFGDKIAGTVMARQEGLQSAKVGLRTGALHHSLAQASAANRGTRAKFGQSGAVMRTDDQGAQWERENASLVERGVSLRPDFAYKPVPAPHITTKLSEIIERLEKLASTAMDIPFQLIESSGGRNSANVQGNLRFVNERIKDWTDTFEGIVKKLFLIAYGKIIQEGLDKARKPKMVDTPAKLLQLYADTEVVVYMPCTPIASPADIAAVHMAGYMKKEKAAEHTFNILGLSHADLAVSEYPDMVPREKVISAAKPDEITPKDSINLSPAV